MRAEQEILEITLRIATEDERIRAVYLFGSRANPDVKKDQYQDYDISFVVTETESFQTDKKWLNAFGDTAILIEGERNGLLFFGKKDMSVLSRRCVFSFLFSDGNRLDLVVEIKEEAMKNFVICKPNKILIDKDNFLSGIAIPTVENSNIEKPNEDMYRACCSGHWWFIVYAAKGIAREQIPFAMESFNNFTRVTLNRMIEWYIGTQTDFSVSTGKRGKYYEKYLSKELYDLFSRTYFDSDLWNIIFNACELFNKLALHVGTHFGFTYNQKEEDSMIEYLRKIKNGCIK